MMAFGYKSALTFRVLPCLRKRVPDLRSFEHPPVLDYPLAGKG